MRETSLDINLSRHWSLMFDHLSFFLAVVSAELTAITRRIFLFVRLSDVRWAQ